MINPALTNQKSALQQFLRLCEISMDVYSKSVYDSGISFAEHYYHNDEQVVSLVTGCKAYWDWWTNTVEQITVQFINTHKNSRWDGHKFYDLWYKLLNPAIITAYPNERAIDKELSLVWSKAWKEKHVLNNLKNKCK